MNVRIGLLGVEVLTITLVPLDHGYDVPAGRPALDPLIKRVSRAWVARMAR